MARTIAGETLIVPVRGGVGDLASIFSLNELGSFLWRNLAPPKSFEELVDLVVGEYEVTNEVACRDIQNFLDTIKEARLIEVVGEEAA